MAGRAVEILLGGALAIGGFAVEEITTNYMQDRIAVNDELKGREPSESMITNLGRFVISDHLTTVYVGLEPMVGGFDATDEQQAVFTNTLMADFVAGVGYGAAIALVTSGGLSVSGRVDFSRKVGAVARA